MKNIQRKYFIDEIKSVNDFMNSRAFFKEEAKWVSFDEVATSDAEVELLTKKFSSGFLREKNSNLVVFKLNKGTLIIVPFKKGTRNSTLENKLKILERCSSNAEKSFFANHDPLTGLLNRNGAKNEYEKHLKILTNITDDVENESALLSLKPQTGLIAFDIDNFKQVNDLFSHDHGDVILKAFSSRLFTSLEKLRQKFNCEFILSRPGGEEFELLILGEIDKLIIDQIAKDIKDYILSPQLPTSDEFRKTAVELNLASIDEFKGFITSSIGTSLNFQADKKNYNDIYSNLRSEADAALSRAKNDGKNCIRHYDDISRMHGKIHEHHEDSDLVIIDIGKKVGVKDGFRYKVFFPPFDGSRQILKNDGRSTKILGSYPKIESGELVVIQAQEKVSVCEIVSRTNSHKFPEFSSLEYIPIGTSARLIDNPRGSLNWPAFGKTNELISSINSKLIEKKLSGVIAIEIANQTNTNTSNYLGTFAYLLPEKTEFFIVNSTTVYAVVEDTSDFREVVESCFDKPFELDTKWGVVDVNKLNTGLVKSAESLIYFSNLALRFKGPNNDKKTGYTFFSVAIGHTTIRNWIGLGLIDDAITDYSLLIKYGVNTAGIHNQLGLVLLNDENREYVELSEKLFMKATEIDPNEMYFQLNLGLSKTLLEKYDESFPIYDKYSTQIFDSSSKVGIGYGLAYAVSTIECFVKHNKIKLSKVRSINSVALEKTTNNLNIRNQRWKIRIEAFEKISQDS